MAILNFLHTISVNIFAVFADFRFSDFLDICFVTFIIYNAIKIIRETRSATLVKGLLLLGAVYAGVSLLVASRRVRCPPADIPIAPIFSGSKPRFAAWLRIMRTARCPSSQAV